MWCNTLRGPVVQNKIKWKFLQNKIQTDMKDVSYICHCGRVIKAKRLFGLRSLFKSCPAWACSQLIFLWAQILSSIFFFREHGWNIGTGLTSGYNKSHQMTRSTFHYDYSCIANVWSQTLHNHYDSLLLDTLHLYKFGSFVSLCAFACITCYLHSSYVCMYVHTHCKSV